MSILSEIQRLQDAKVKLIKALNRKGVDVSSSDTLDEFPEKIDSITKGEEISYLPNPNGYLSFKFMQDGKFY